MNSYRTTQNALWVKGIVDQLVLKPDELFTLDLFIEGIQKTTFTAKWSNGYAALVKDEILNGPAYAELRTKIRHRFAGDGAVQFIYLPNANSLRHTPRPQLSVAGPTNLKTKPYGYFEPDVAAAKHNGFQADWRPRLIAWLSNATTPGAVHVLHADLSDDDYSMVQNLIGAIPHIEINRIDSNTLKFVVKHAI